MAVWYPVEAAVDRLERWQLEALEEHTPAETVPDMISETVDTCIQESTVADSRQAVADSHIHYQENYRMGGVPIPGRVVEEEASRTHYATDE